MPTADGWKVALTRYQGGAKGPVLLAPGFSVKALSFATDTVARNLVEELCANLIEINREGVAILLVEQDVLTALDLAERGYVFESGRIAMSGTSDELIANQEVKRAYLGI